MQRNILALALGVSVLGAAALAACSSGGGSATAVPSTVANLPTGASSASLSGGTLTLTINRAKTAQVAGPKHANSKARRAEGTRKPQYVSSGANGLQVTVSTAATSKSIYADISAASPLCTLNLSTNIETCTITVPTVGTNETIVASEVDQVPAGDTNGYGTSFPSNSNILAAGTTSATVNGGVVTVALGLSPVFYLIDVANGDRIGDCSEDGTYSNINSDIDFTNSNSPRLLVTAGLAQDAYFYACFWDAVGDNPQNEPTPVASPLPFVDVNASPEPLIVTSSTQHLLFALYTSANTATPPPSGSYGLTASASNESALLYNYYLCFSMQLDGALTSPATVTVSNNLKATSPFSGSTFATPPPTMTYTVVPVSVTPTSGINLSIGTTDTATVTGSDYQGTGGMAVSGSSSNTNQYNGMCVDNGGNALATVAQSASIDTNAWTQPFLITGTNPGTCTFYLYDVTSANYGYSGNGVESQAVTVNIVP